MSGDESVQLLILQTFSSPCLRLRRLREYSVQQMPVSPKLTG